MEQPFMPVKNAAYFRARARGALKGFYWYAVLAFLIAALLGGAGGLSVNFDFEQPEELEAEEVQSFLHTFADKAERFTDILATEGISGVFAAYSNLWFFAVIAGIVFLLAMAFVLLVSASVAVGYQKYNLDLIDGKDQKKMGTLFAGFSQSYGKNIWLHVIYALIGIACTLPLAILSGGMMWFNRGAVLNLLRGDLSQSLTVLGCILLIFAAAILTVILQIIVQYRYYFAAMILAEYPQIRVIDAFRNSASLMRGRKRKLFCLQLSFIGWYLLAALTFGVGFILLMPYCNAANAAFYDEIANRAAAREAEFPSLDPNDYYTE